LGKKRWRPFSSCIYANNLPHRMVCIHILNVLIIIISKMIFIWIICMTYVINILLLYMWQHVTTCDNM
jgi:hypothetical protein